MTQAEQEVAVLQASCPRFVRDEPIFLFLEIDQGLSEEAI